MFQLLEDAFQYNLETWSHGNEGKDKRCWPTGLRREVYRGCSEFQLENIFGDRVSCVCFHLQLHHVLLVVSTRNLS